jgi:hypothetical protein
MKKIASKESFAAEGTENIVHLRISLKKTLSLLTEF